MSLTNASEPEGRESDTAGFQDQIDLARDGDREALGEILQAHQRYLLTVAHYRLSSRDLSGQCVSDLVQLTMFEAVRDIQRFHGNTQSEFRAWLRQILKCNLADAVRSKKRTGQVHRAECVDDHSPIGEAAEPQDNSPLLSTIAAKNEQRAATRRILNQLPDRSRQVILLRNFLEMTWEEVGQEMGCSMGAAQKLWMRTMKKLGKILRPLL